MNAERTSGLVQTSVETMSDAMETEEYNSGVGGPARNEGFHSRETASAHIS